MTTINLRDYYPIYKENTFIDVSDEIATFLAEEKRLQTNYEQYIRDNKAFYSLNCGDGIEVDALDSADALHSFGQVYMQLSSASVAHASDDSELACDVIEVLPLQTAYLTAAQAGSYFRIEEIVPDWISFDCFYKRIKLLII